MLNIWLKMNSRSPPKQTICSLIRCLQTLDYYDIADNLKIKYEISFGDLSGKDQNVLMLFDNLC